MKKRKKGTGNEKRTNKKNFNVIEVVIIMVITCLFGIFMGSIVTFITIKTKPEIKNESNDDKYLERFKDSYNDILSSYYHKINKQELIDSAIEGMIDYLDDPYASYMNEEESTSFSETVEGEYVGIGCEITLNEDEQAVITKVFKSSPAEKQGLKVGDVILSVNDKKINNSEDFMNLSEIKGKENTKVTLIIKRKDIEKTIVLTRKRIEIDSIESEIKTVDNKRIGIIKINVFAANTDKQFKKHLSKLEKKNIDSLIIDVRDNNGGYLSTVTDIASEFLKKNKIIYQLSSKGINEPILDKTKQSKNYKVVVVINETSASASEILAAALKESYNATIVGTNSFGKGTVQKAYQLPNGTSYKYTIQKWLTPKGNDIDKKGITPDIIEIDKNKQMDKAIEVLIK